jgi:Transglycosylase SLT domain
VRLPGLVFILVLILLGCRDQFVNQEALADSVGLQRCRSYIPEIRKWNSYYWGLDFPYWYAVGQAETESACRSSAVSFDGGEGLMQFMPDTERYCERYIGALNMLNPSHAIKANAWYMKQLHKENWDGALWLDMQAYNGGWSLLKKEQQRAGITNHDIMRIYCRRNIIRLRNGQLLDFCAVNYDYSTRVYLRGNQYRVSSDKMKFW